MTLQRRHTLALGAALATGLLVRPGTAATGDLAAAVAAYAGGKTLQPGKVKLDISTLVENGNAVPLTVSVDSPMTGADHVLSVALFNERNPQREIATFFFGPHAARATASTRIRLATSQKLVAVALLSDGTAWSQTVDVIVTLAACIE